MRLGWLAVMVFGDGAAGVLHKGGALYHDAPTSFAHAKANSAALRPILPMEMNNWALHHCSLCLPAAILCGSPTTGTHDSSNTGLPQRRMRASARSSWPLRGTRNGRRQAMRRPRTQEVMPPRVFPALATMSSSHLSCG